MSTVKPIVKVPSKIKEPIEFFDHQVQGIRDMIRMGNTILADEMGLGKTLQMLTVMAVDFDRGARLAVIVTESGLKENIETEILNRTHFTVLNLPNKISLARRKKLLEGPLGQDILLVGYEQVAAVDYSELDGQTVTLEFKGITYKATMTSDARGRVLVEGSDKPLSLDDAARQITKSKRTQGENAWHLDDGRPVGMACWRAVDAINALKPDFIAYDEAHNIKNSQAERTKACLMLDAARHVPMTGSPILNQVDDLWTLLHRVAPDEYPNYWKFRNRYCVTAAAGRKTITGVKNEAELHRRLSAVMVRRLKKDCLDLPEKQYIPVVVDLTPTQRMMYDEALRDMVITIPGDPTPMEVENALTRFLRLKQICGSAGTIPGYTDESAKLDVMVTTAKEIIDSGEPVVIFTQFRQVLEFAVERLRKAGILTWQLHGDVPMAERHGVITEWEQHAKAGMPGAIVCMYQVAGRGYNMTVASKMIRIDKLWTPKLNEQAEDRIHRIGSKETCQYFDLICKGTVERRVEQINRAKTKVHRAVVEGDETAWKRELVLALRDSLTDTATDD